MEVDASSDHQRCSGNWREPQFETSVGDLRRSERATSKTIFEISVRSFAGDELCAGKRGDELAIQGIFEAMRKAALYYWYINTFLFLNDTFFRSHVWLPGVNSLFSASENNEIRFVANSDHQILRRRGLKDTTGASS